MTIRCKKLLDDLLIEAKDISIGKIRMFTETEALQGERHLISLT